MRNFRLDDESGHQEALFEWAAYHMDCMPELEYMHHIPNGGKRDKRTAVALKRQGVSQRLRAVPLKHWKRHYSINQIILWTRQNLLSVWQRMWL